MQLTIYICGGIEQYTQAFNALAAVVSSKQYQVILRLFALFALSWVVFESAFKQSTVVNIRWFYSVFIIYNVLLVPKTDVILQDSIFDQQHKVSNIPIGLALPASIASQISKILTSLADKAFSLPNNLQYSHSGLLFASRIVDMASQFEISNPNFKASIDSFMRQCVFYDLLLEKYSFKTLVSTENIWSLISANASPARMFYLHNKLVSCQQGVKQLNTDWKTEIKHAAISYGLKLSPQLQKQQATKYLFSYLPVSYHYLAKTSNSAAKIMQQNMLMNAFRQGFLNFGAISNSTAAIQSYAEQRSHQLLRVSFYLKGTLAHYWLPLLKTCLSIFVYSAFFIIFPLFFLPYGIGILRNYLITLLWLQLWDPLYAILNLIMSSSAAHQSFAEISNVPGGAVSLMTQVGLARINADISAVASMLSWSIPIIAYSLIRGGSAGLSQLFHVASGAVSVAAMEASTGNYQLGNTQFANHQLQNSQALHHNHDASWYSGNMRFNHASGTQITLSNSGVTTIDTSNANSRIPGHLHLATSYSHRLSEAADQITSNEYTKGQQLVNSTSDAIRDLTELGEHKQNYHKLDQTNQTDYSSAFHQSAANVSNLVHDFSEQHHLSLNKSYQLLAQAQIAKSLSGEIKAGLPIKWLPLSANAKVNASTTTSNTRTHSDSVNIDRTYLAAEKLVKSNVWSKSIEQAKNQSKRYSQSSGTEYSSLQIRKWSDDISHINSLQQDVRQQLKTANTYRTTADSITEQRVQWDAQLDQAFVEWLVKQKNSNGGQPIGWDNALHIINREPELLQRYTQTFLQLYQQQTVKN